MPATDHWLGSGRGGLGIWPLPGQRARLNGWLRVLGSAVEEVYVFDAASLRLLALNGGARRSLGYLDEDLPRLTAATLYDGLDASRLSGYLASLRTGDASSVTYRARHRRAGGGSYPVDVRLSFHADERPPLFLAVAADISEREAQEEQLRRMAYFDSLTGLPNRPLLQDRLRQAMLAAGRLNRQLAVLFVDLDGFKLVNDEHGHDIGDAVLRSVAERMTATLRASDTVARLGGDEFVVLAPGQRNLDDARLTAQKLLAALAQPMLLGSRRLDVSASIGLTLYPQDDGDAETLVRHADMAMYAAKRTGRNRVCIFGA
ncbi:MAG: GGDEF domain-containing protein [Nevskia sp.]|nr:GGDEF domain-containing protein [Nevskia sp.]